MQTIIVINENSKRKHRVIFDNEYYTFFPTWSTSLTAAVASAVVKVAVKTEHSVSPTMIHTIENNRAITDLGALSPYLKTRRAYFSTGLNAAL